MRIAYITVRTPLGPGESFIIPEVRGLLDCGLDITIFPILPGKKIWHESLQSLEGNCHFLNLYSPKVLLLAIQCIIAKPLKSFNAVFHLLRVSSSLKILFKNLTIIPRALAAVCIFEDLGIDHIHAHWGTRTATLGLLVSHITGIPWSFTAHRWDIYENNILSEKVESADFVRCISRKGVEDLVRLSRVSSGVASKVRVVYMGVELPKEHNTGTGSASDSLRISVPANMLPVKGHRYLIDAISLLQASGDISIRCSFFGDGPLEVELREHVANLGLEQVIFFQGRVAHADLLKAYRNAEFDVVVLPSVVTSDGHHEGIPVCLIEAMAHGLPVISTRTGSIPELVGKDTGILVPQKDPAALACALRQVAEGGDKIKNMVSAAKNKVEQEYAIQSIVRKLAGYFSG